MTVLPAGLPETSRTCRCGRRYLAWFHDRINGRIVWYWCERCDGRGVGNG